MISSVKDKQCVVCGREYSVDDPGAGVKMCGNECRMQRAREEEKAWRLRQPPIAAVCVECGEDFLSPGGRGRPRKTCGPLCAGKRNGRQSREQAKANYESRPLHEHHCKICGKVWESKKPKQKCPDCRDSTGARLRQVICSECGDTFTTSKGRHLTCSAKCAELRRRRSNKERRVKAAEQWRANGCPGRRGEKKQVTIHIEEIRRIGNSAEAMFDLLCAVRGWANAEPRAAASCPGFDRVINRGHGWETVQVKGIGNKQGDKDGAFQLKGSCKQYDEGAFDVLAAIDTATGDAWLVPFDVATRKLLWRPEREWEEYKIHVLSD